MTRRQHGTISIAAAVIGAVIATGPAAHAQARQPIDLGHGIYAAIGVAVGTGGASGATTVAVPQSNTFMIVTNDGNVIVDTSGPAGAAVHHQMLTAISSAPVKAVILTHGHGDHTGGVTRWRGPATDIVAHRSFGEFLDYQRRLAGFFATRNAAQFGRGAVPAVGRGAAPAAAQAAALQATKTFDDTLTLSIGGVAFEILHTPGETPDHLSVWLPQFRTAFIGDNYYDSFPNIYTLRGTRPRWALDYVESLNRVLALAPEMVLPSHGQPIRGRDEIRKRLTKYRDAIKFVHDRTVAGMNEGKDVFTVMREVTLPPDLDIGETYGKISWSVRGIYEGYAGWFDGNPSAMFGTPASAYGEVVRLAGGADALAARAKALVTTDPIQALYLTDIAMAAEPTHVATLEARLAALKLLEQRSGNSNERGWLQAGIRDAEAKLKR
jgi:alkyl sulfatase BDS1-like metallo-beta-lactamase superfamily hydrolase